MAAGLVMGGLFSVVEAPLPQVEGLVDGPIPRVVSGSDRRPSAMLIQAMLFVLGSITLVTMAIFAHSLAYFPGDVTISQAVQAYSSSWLDEGLGAVSWTGFPPQSHVLFGSIVALLWALRARWAAVNSAVSAVGSGSLYLLLEHVVGQPRPSPELVRVVGPIEMTGFPSGHVATFTAVFGFVAYLAYRRLGPSGSRWLPVALVAVLLAIMSFARIYAGHHWASDVVAGLLIGFLWLEIVIWTYAWGKRRFRAHARLPHRALFRPHPRSVRPTAT